VHRTPLWLGKGSYKLPAQVAFSYSTTPLVRGAEAKVPGGKSGVRVRRKPCRATGDDRGTHRGVIWRRTTSKISELSYQE
jgi:hypothetical protein